MNVPLFQEILVIFALSMGVLLFCHRLRLPPIVGFLVTGVLCGPHGLGFVQDVQDVQELAEIGIVLLLFTVGMEFSLKKIGKYKRFFFGGGLLQVVLTTLAGFFAAWWYGLSTQESIFIGFLLALSSTAVVMRVLDESGTGKTPHGKLIVGTLIFQDIAVVPMMLSIPLLAGGMGTIDSSLFLLFGKGVVILAIIFLSAERIVPFILYVIAKTRSRELFLLAVLLICFSVALLVAQLGLSFSLGAFLAGLTLADTEYRNKAIDDILPFKDIFTSFFFVSIGMLLDLRFVVASPLPILALTFGVVFVKGTIMTIVGLLIGMPLRTAALTGLALAQVGEFSFVLAEAGTHANIWNIAHDQLFLAVAILTMAAAPTLMQFAPILVDKLLGLPFPDKLKRGISPVEDVPEPQMEKHLIIVGYGVVGKNLGRSCQEAEIPYTVIDMDATLVRQGRKKHVPIHFGDATHELTLKHVNAAKAEVIAVLINDTIAALRVIETVKRINPDIYVIARTHHLDDMKPLFQLGADDVIVDEFGSAIEIFTRVLQKYSVPSEDIEKRVHTMRSEGYEMLRIHHKESAIFSNMKWKSDNIEVASIPLSECSSIVGKTLVEASLRQTFGVNVIAIKRGGDSLHHMDGQTRLKEKDLLVVMGTPEGIAKMQNS